MEFTIFLKNDSEYRWNVSFYNNEKIPLNILIKIVQSIFENKEFNIGTIILENLSGIDDGLIISKSEKNNYEDYADQLLKNFYAET